MDGDLNKKYSSANLFPSAKGRKLSSYIQWVSFFPMSHAAPALILLLRGNGGLVCGEKDACLATISDSGLRNRHCQIEHVHWVRVEHWLSRETCVQYSWGHDENHVRSRFERVCVLCDTRAAWEE